MFFHPTSMFKAYAAAQRALQDEMRRSEEALTIHGDPCSCYQCQHSELEEVTTSKMEYQVMEYEVVCKKCLTQVAYWAHGYYQPVGSPPNYELYF